MLKVDRIQVGIVLDHIRAGNGLRIFEELGLAGREYPVALLMNVPSTKMGRKDMIKVSGALHLDRELHRGRAGGPQGEARATGTGSGPHPLQEPPLHHLHRKLLPLNLYLGGQGREKIQVFLLR